jgi:single-strand DNA-binding protein
MSKGTVNKAILVGRLGGDPEVRYVPSGSPVANFSLATNRSYKDKDGNFQEETDWHRVAAWNRLAEFAKQYLHKGMRVYVEGRIQYRDWQDQNGVKRNATDIVALDIQMLEPPSTRTGGETENLDEPDLKVPDDLDQAPDETVPF